MKIEDNEAPVFEAGVLLCFVLNRDRAFLYAHPEAALKPEDEKRYLKLILSRAAGMPLQHLTGVQEFMSLNFKVSPAVLIPRQDTEILVEAVMASVDEMRGRKKPEGPEVEPSTIRILDIGTGSGCIALSLAHHISNASLVAVDISEEALALARENARVLGLADRVHFLRCDLFDAFEAGQESFDIILSNPPYIPTAHIQYLQREVRDHEPPGALDGGRDGLVFYRRITAGSILFLKPHGGLFFEIGYDQGSAVSTIMGEYFQRVEVLKDLSGMDRVVFGEFPIKKP